MKRRKATRRSGTRRTCELDGEQLQELIASIMERLRRSSPGQRRAAYALEYELVSIVERAQTELAAVEIRTNAALLAAFSKFAQQLPAPPAPQPRARRPSNVQLYDKARHAVAVVIADARRMRETLESVANDPDVNVAELRRQLAIQDVTVQWLKQELHALRRHKGSG